jgi:hypothetical protein
VYFYVLCSVRAWCVILCDMCIFMCCVLFELGVLFCVIRVFLCAVSVRAWCVILCDMCIFMCCVLFELGVLFCVIYVFLCVVPYCSSTATGQCLQLAAVRRYAGVGHTRSNHTFTFVTCPFVRMMSSPLLTLSLCSFLHGTCFFFFFFFLLPTSPPSQNIGIMLPAHAPVFASRVGSNTRR